MSQFGVFLSSALWKRMTIGLGLLLLVYLSIAYLLLPMLWVGYAHRHPALDQAPRITHTFDDIPGDPLNVALEGTELEVKKLLLAAHWVPADPLTLKSCLEIAEATVLKRTYDTAPVSNLYLFGRKEDLAFEKPVGNDPRQRHHVRFWKSDTPTSDGRPFWFGSVTYDKKVGLSHTTGKITHHIDADLDKERDFLFHDLEQTRLLSEVYQEDGFQTQLKGHNGGGDPWYTDGNLVVGVIQPLQ